MLKLACYQQAIFMNNPALEKKYSKFLENTNLATQTDIKEVEKVWERAKSDFLNNNITISEFVGLANYLWAYHIQSDFMSVTSTIGYEIYDVAELLIHVNNVEENKDSFDEDKKKLYQRSMAEIELVTRQLKTSSDIKNRE